jgi:electron transfer flavoprotein beta subunit
VVTKITAGADSLECSKEGDGLTETIKVPLPCLVTVQKGINEPRYPTMKNIMAAKKKSVQTLALSELGAYEAKTMIQSFSLPPSKQAGQQVQDEGGNAVPQLVAFLKERMPGL